MNIDLIMKMLPSSRRRNRNRRRGPFEIRPARSQTDLINYLIEHDIHTTGQLNKKRQHGDPTLYDFIKAFNSWKESQILAFGPPPPFKAPEKPSPEYLIKCCRDYNLWRRRDWHEARRKNPEIIPSINQCRRIFNGRFGNLTWAAEKVSVKRTVERCMSLTRRLGHIPSALECRQYDVDLDPLRSVYHSKRGVNEFLKLLSVQMRGEKNQDFSDISVGNPSG